MQNNQKTNPANNPRSQQYPKILFNEISLYKNSFKYKIDLLTYLQFLLNILMTLVILVGAYKFINGLSISFSPTISIPREKAIFLARIFFILFFLSLLKWYIHACLAFLAFRCINSLSFNLSDGFIECTNNCFSLFVIWLIREFIYIVICALWLTALYFAIHKAIQLQFDLKREQIEIFLGILTLITGVLLSLESYISFPINLFSHLLLMTQKYNIWRALMQSMRVMIAYRPILECLSGYSVAESAPITFRSHRGIMQINVILMFTETDDANAYLARAILFRDIFKLTADVE